VKGHTVVATQIYKVLETVSKERPAIVEFEYS